MKKILVSLFLLVFGLCLVGCDNFGIINIPSSDSILITKYDNTQEIQTIIVEELEVIEHITHNFNSLTVSKMDYIKPHETMYTFIFYDCTNENESKVVKKVEVETTQCLSFDDSNEVYGINKGEIDLEYIDSLFTTYLNIEWQSNETHHWYKSNSDTMYCYGEHQNFDADLICDICGCGLELQVPTNHFLRNQLGCEWLNEIKVDDINEIKIITESVGVAPGVLKNIASSIDKTVISKIYENCYWLDTIPISKEEGQISGGRATTIRFILNDSTVKEIYINNGNYKDPNAYYYKLLYIPKFSENDEYESSYGFITYLDTFEVYTLDGLKLGSFSGLSEYEFIKYPYDYIEENEDLGYIETEFGRIYIHSYDVFYIKDGNVYEFYLITSERTFYDLFSMDD
ncbi:MAG: hypothetical protein J6K18_01545 [Bacilli bacterium]|nr:hypothetical protein [Bacilli bacterium]